MISFSRSHFLDILGLVALGAVVYCNVVNYPFVHDDKVFIAENPDIDKYSISLVFKSQANLQFNPLTNPYYRPLLDLYYRVVYHVFGANPHAYHSLNIVIHIINGLLVYVLMMLIRQARPVSFLIAALFLVHPVQTEAVACIAGISNLLSAMFFLLALMVFLQASQRTGIKILVTGICYLLAVMCKEQAIVLPAVLLGLTFLGIPQKGKDFRDYGIRTAGALGVAAVFYFIWRQMLFGGNPGGILDHPDELMLRLGAIPRTFVMYLRVLFLPYDLHYYRSIDILQNSWIDFAVLAAVIAAGFVVVRKSETLRRPVLAAAAGWFVLTLLPVLNIIPLIHEYSLIAAFEHFLYLPSVGFFLFVVAAGEGAIRKLSSRYPLAVRTGLIAVVAGCASIAVFQNTLWRAEVPLFERVVKYEPRFGRGWMLLGQSYAQAGQPALAVSAYEKALGIMEGYLKAVGDSALPDVRNFYRQYVRDIHLNLAAVYKAQGLFPQAIEILLSEQAADPDNVSLWGELGILYHMSGDQARALDCFMQAASREPQDPRVLTNAAVFYLNTGDFAKAREWLEQALKADASYQPARLYLESLSPH